MSNARHLRRLQSRHSRTTSAPRERSPIGAEQSESSGYGSDRWPTLAATPSPAGTTPAYDPQLLGTAIVLLKRENRELREQKDDLGVRANHILMDSQQKLAALTEQNLQLQCESNVANRRAKIAVRINTNMDAAYAVVANRTVQGVHHCNRRVMNEFASNVMALTAQVLRQLTEGHDAVAADGQQDLRDMNAAITQEANAIQAARIKCPHCSADYSSGKWLRNHIREKHPGV